jgi:hypothetical protein
MRILRAIKVLPRLLEQIRLLIQQLIRALSVVLAIVGEAEAGVGDMFVFAGEFIHSQTASLSLYWQLAIFSARQVER